MRITNRLGLPEAIVNAVRRDPYTKGKANFSCTGLIRPPLMARLERDHRDELEEDVIDRIWALRGQVIHGILERGADDDQISEVRLFAEFDRWRISGQADVYLPDAGLLQDFKDTSVWSVIHGPKTEWVQQLNILAELVRRNGGLVTQLQIVAFFRDWSATKALAGGNYPHEKVQIVPVPLWSSQQATKYILERCKLHQEALDAEDVSQVPPCTDEEVWAKPTKWAVMKKGRKSAVKLHDFQKAAEQHAGELGKNHWVEERPGSRPRCEGYCSVASFCPVWRDPQMLVRNEKVRDQQDVRPSDQETTERA